MEGGKGGRVCVCTCVEKKENKVEWEGKRDKRRKEKKGERKYLLRPKVEAL